MLTCANSAGAPFHRQIIAIFVLKTESVLDCTAGLMRVRKRYERQGSQGPKAWYSDRCCAERGWLHSIFESLKTRSKPRPPPGKLPVYEPVADPYVWKRDGLNIVDTIRRQAVKYKGLFGGLEGLRAATVAATATNASPI